MIMDISWLLSSLQKKEEEEGEEKLTFLLFIGEMCGDCMERIMVTQVFYWLIGEDLLLSVRFLLSKKN